MPVRASIRRAVEKRARERCEYCLAPQWVCGYRFHVEHIVPRASGGGDDLSNLALACSPCNLAKGSRTLAIDPESHVSTPFFHPRHTSWNDHFAWTDDFATIVGTTPIGRATCVALEMNGSLQRNARVLWLEPGLRPNPGEE